MTERDPFARFPAPSARRVGRNSIAVTYVAPTSSVLTDAEARALIQQLQLALTYPAPAEQQGENHEP